jgi:hypothetical protein
MASACHLCPIVINMGLCRQSAVKTASRNSIVRNRVVPCDSDRSLFMFGSPCISNHVCIINHTMLCFFSFIALPRLYMFRYGDSLRAGGPGIESRWGSRFSAPVQTGPGAHPASSTVGTGSFPGVKRPERDVDHPPSSSAEDKERIKLYIYSPSGPSWPVLG